MYKVYVNNVYMGTVNNPEESHSLVTQYINPLCMEYAIIVLKKIKNNC